MNSKNISQFLGKVTAEVPSAVILGGDSSNGLAFVRSLGRRGIPVLSVGRGTHPAMRSRYGIACIQPVHGDAALLDLLVWAGQQLPVKGVIIPCADDYVGFLSRHRAALDPYYEFVLSEEALLGKLASKKSQYQLAQEAGIPIPKTFSVTGKLESFSSDIGYPCIIKPAYSHLWVEFQERAQLKWAKLLVAHSPKQLMGYGSIVSDSGLEWVVQELIEGTEDELYALYAYFDRSSKPLAVFVRRKLRQWPVDYGSGCYSIGVWEKELVDLGIQLFQSIGYQGLTNTEFKRDARDGKFKLIEINVRSASQVSLAIDSGVDLPFVAYRDALRKPEQPVADYKPGRRWVHLDADRRSFLEYRRRGELGLGAWLASLSAVRSHAYWAWDDPIPAFSIVLRGISGKLAKLFKRFTR